MIISQSPDNGGNLAWVMHFAAGSIPVGSFGASYASVVQQGEVIRQANAFAPIVERIGVDTSLTNDISIVARHTVEDRAIGASLASALNPEEPMVAPAGNSIPVLVGQAGRPVLNTTSLVVIPFIAVLALVAFLNASPSIPDGMVGAAFTNSGVDRVKSLIAHAVDSVAHRVRGTFRSWRDGNAYPTDSVEAIVADTGSDTPVLVGPTDVRELAKAHHPDLREFTPARSGDGVEGLAKRAEGIASVRDTDSIVNLFVAIGTSAVTIFPHLELGALSDAVSVDVI